MADTILEQIDARIQELGGEVLLTSAQALSQGPRE